MTEVRVYIEFTGIVCSKLSYSHMRWADPVCPEEVMSRHKLSYPKIVLGQKIGSANFCPVSHPANFCPMTGFIVRCTLGPFDVRDYGPVIANVISAARVASKIILAEYTDRRGTNCSTFVAGQQPKFLQLVSIPTRVDHQKLLYKVIMLER